MSAHSKRCMTRRGFLSAAVAGGTVSLAGSTIAAAPAVITAPKTDSKTVVGQGDYRFEVEHDWAKLPEQFQWQITHNVAVDKEGLVYVIHEGRRELKDHPSVFVFDEHGRYVRSFGSQFQGGGHGIEIRQEDGQEFLYVCAYQHLKTFAKLDLKGQTIWRKYAPMQSGVYATGEDTDPKKVWGRDRFMPTNFAFLPDGDFLLADGYGAFYIHRYDKDGNWKSCFGGPGKGKGKFQTPHGIWIDRRPGRKPMAVVADRANHTLQYVTIDDGEHVETLEGYGLPANIDTHQDLMVVPELFARVSLLNAKNEVVAKLGDDSQRIRADSKRAIRGNEKAWKDGRFVHPHDACFDNQGNIFVAEWVASGRVSKLKRLV